MLVKFLRKHFKNEFIFGFDKKSRNKLLLQISIIDLVLILIRTAILYPSATNSLQYTYLMGINIVIRLAVIGMLLKGHSDPAAHIYIFSFWVYLTLSAISTGSAFSQHSMGFFVVITMAITLISLNIGILYLFLSISMTATLTMFDVGRLGIPIVVSDTPLTRLITIVTYFILLTLLLKLIQSSLRKLASRGRDINRRYKALFDSTEEGVFIADMELKLIAVNQAAADLLGYEIDELIGTSQFEHIDPEEIKAMGPMIKKLKQGKTIGRFERKMICKDGSRVDLDVNVIPVKDEDGKMFNFQVIIRDISAQKRLEESLHNSLSEMEILARTDPLTGISNRRALEEQGSLHMRLARLGELNLGLIMLDVDH